MRNQTLQTLTTGTAAALAALIVAGGASAADAVARPDDRPTHGPGAIANAQRDVVLRPDDRADRRLPNEAPVVQPASASGFDWFDAGIGAAATLGVVLLVAGGSVVILRHGAQTA
jgi:hypothetical protein